MHYKEGVGFVDASGKKVCSKRTMDLTLAKSYGASGDTASFTRLIIESKVSRKLLNEAYMYGGNS